MVMMIVMFLVQMVIASTLGALALLVVAPLTADRRPDFEEAFKAMFIVYLCLHIAGRLMRFLLADLDPTLYEAVGAVVGFVVLTIVLGYVIEATIPRAALTAATLIALLVLFRLGLRALGDALDEGPEASSLAPIPAWIPMLA